MLESELQEYLNKMYDNRGGVILFQIFIFRLGWLTCFCFCFFKRSIEEHDDVKGCVCTDRNGLCIACMYLLLHHANDGYGDDGVPH